MLSSSISVSLSLSPAASESMSQKLALIVDLLFPLWKQSQLPEFVVSFDNFKSGILCNIKLHDAGRNHLLQVLCFAFFITNTKTLMS